LIWNPQLADYNWVQRNKENDLNYDVFCGYLCVPRNKPLFIKSGGGSIAVKE